jgi:ABC-type amino acid transport substrate-binding protein
VKSHSRLAACAFISNALFHAAWGQSVSVCAHRDPPPWTYTLRDAQGKPKEEFVGASVDIIRATFQRIGITVEFTCKYPWVRCLAMVEDGSIDFAMDAYYDALRGKRFA